MIERDYFAYKKLSFFRRLTGHIGTISKHKHYVRKACFKMGRYWQGITHDLSKFSPTEFIPSVRYYSGTFSPNITDRIITGTSRSWLHHKGRNKHHYEYWIDYSSEHSAKLVGCKMPMKYVAEMIADRYAASVAYNGDKYTQSDAWNYYCHGKDAIIIHDDTRAVLEKALIIMRDEGEEEAFKFVKKLLKVTKKNDYSIEMIDSISN